MKRSRLKLFLRITGITVFILLVVISILMYRFTTPKNDFELVEALKEEGGKPVISHIDFQGHRVRIIQMQDLENPNLPTLVFIHGSPGSAMDFKRYLMDKRLNERANLIAYDRVGYSNNETGVILPSLEKEIALLHKIVEGLDPKKTMLIGYSYGGTVALASPKNYLKKVSLASAVRGDLEPMFWALNLCKWSITKPLVPSVFMAAAEEKFRHVTELQTYEDKWSESDSQVLSIHGKEDIIVPYENSLYLAEQLRGKFQLVTLEEGNHALIWTNFELIHEHILKSLAE